MYREETNKSIRFYQLFPANKRRWHNAGSMSARRLRRRPDIEPALGQLLLCWEFVTGHEEHPFSDCSMVSANTRRWTNDGLLLTQRRRRWVNSKPSLVQHFVFVEDRYLCRRNQPEDTFSYPIYSSPTDLRGVYRMLFWARSTPFRYHGDLLCHILSIAHYHDTTYDRVLIYKLLNTTRVFTQ